MGATIPGHIDLELWNSLPGAMRQACLEAHELLKEDTLESKIKALEMCPFWMMSDYYQVMRTDRRSDYANMDDASFANFREVATTGIAPGVLYRSSSAFWPGLGRNELVDAAAQEAGINTVIDIANSTQTVARWPQAQSSYCMQQNVFFLHMTMFFKQPEQRALMAKFLRTIIYEKGPFLVFCMEGQDRTGYVIAILECLMGASLEEIAVDYLITYQNYYHIKMESEVAEVLWRFFSNQLRDAFEVEDIIQTLRAQGNAVKQAEDFILGLGITDEELGTLKAKLAGE